MRKMTQIFLAFSEKLNFNNNLDFFLYSDDLSFRGVNGGWSGWAIAHSVFGRIESAARQQSGGSGAPDHYMPTHF